MQMMTCFKHCYQPIKVVCLISYRLEELENDNEQLTEELKEAKRIIASNQSELCRLTDENADLEDRRQKDLHKIEDLQGRLNKLRIVSGAQASDNAHT